MSEITNSNLFRMHNDAMSEKHLASLWIAPEIGMAEVSNLTGVESVIDAVSRMRSGDPESELSRICFAFPRVKTRTSEGAWVDPCVCVLAAAHLAKNPWKSVKEPQPILYRKRHKPPFLQIRVRGIVDAEFSVSNDEMPKLWDLGVYPIVKSSRSYWVRIPLGSQLLRYRNQAFIVGVKPSCE